MGRFDMLGRSRKRLDLSVQPLAFYARPQYPRFSKDQHFAPRAPYVWHLPHKKIVAAVLAAALPACGGDGILDLFDTHGRTAGTPRYEPPIAESVARSVLLEVFTQYGLAITEDFSFTQDPVAFAADGYDQAKKVGYEYLSVEATDDRQDLTAAEQSAIEGWDAASGPFFLILNSYDFGAYGNDQEVLDRLRTQTEAFLDELQNRGLL